MILTSSSGAFSIKKTVRARHVIVTLHGASRNYFFIHHNTVDREIFAIKFFVDDPYGRN